MKEKLQKLREFALNFQVKPENTIADAASVETVIKVFTDIRKSFQNFLEVVYLKNESYKKAYEKNPKILDDFKKGTELYVVDIKFGSMKASVAPNLIEEENPLFKNEVLEWKIETFSQFKNDVCLGDFQDSEFVDTLLKKYTPEERAKIYKPIFDAMNGNHTINILDKKEKKLNVLVQPDEIKKLQIIPTSITQPKARIEKNVVGYFKILTDGTKIEFKKSNIKQVYDAEVLEHDTYPYKPDTICFGEHTFVLNNKLTCNVTYQDDTYSISYGDLDVNVWGSTREEVEEAFAFTFYSLYLNYCLEEDEKLSLKAREIKKKLSSIIRKYYEG